MPYPLPQPAKFMALGKGSFGIKAGLLGSESLSYPYGHNLLLGLCFRDLCRRRQPKTRDDQEHRNPEGS